MLDTIILLDENLDAKQLLERLAYSLEGAVKVPPFDLLKKV
jgi:hypothetical protein